MKPSLLLSIVIPVYNVSEYVEKSIRSCYKQAVSPSSYEVIVINDGSTDDSLAICERLQEEFTDLKIITQNNKGLSGARNTGLANAHGKYIWFVDSDDWIEENCLTILFEQFKQHDVDIFWIGHDVIYNGKSNQKYIPIKIDSPITGKNLLINHLNQLFYIWKFIYRTTYLLDNNLVFKEGLLFEDLEFTPRALLKAKSCFTIPTSFYNYLIRPGSIANIGNIKDKTINDRLMIISDIIDLEKLESVSASYSRALQLIILDGFLITIKMSARGKLTLAPLAHTVIKKIKSENYKVEKSAADFFIMKNNLKLYHYFFKQAYILASKIKKS